MGRREFMRDLEVVKGSGFEGLTNIERGEDDGSLKFTFASNDLIDKVDIIVFVPNLEEYPKAHKYLIYVTSDDAPDNFTSSLERVQDGCSGHNLPHLLGRIVGALSFSPGIMDESSDDEDEDMEQEFDLGWEPDMRIGDAGDRPRNHESLGSKNWDEGVPTKDFTRKLKLQLKEDLRQVHGAGFRVGVFGDFKGEVFYITISIRISKLGISDEAMAAWLLDKDKYFVLIIRYTNLYKTLERLLQPENQNQTKREIEMCVGLSTSCKPSLSECNRMFTKVKDCGLTTLDGAKEWETGALHSFFMSNAITELLNSRLVSVVRYRLQEDLGWEGAEALFKDIAISPIASAMKYKKCYDIPSESKTALKPIVAADALSKKESRGIESSFPLIAMQYALRHLVRCTEFCLVCHDKIQNDFEAMKPYVCDSPLCLYQYMSLGFGPKIESEILTQPTVVDLLVSFCYSTAEAARLKVFPIGMNILVPSESSHQARYSDSANCVIFPSSFKFPLVKVGDWIYFTKCKDRAPCHLRVTEVYWPQVYVGPPIDVPQVPQDQLPASPPAHVAPPPLHNSIQGLGFSGSVFIHNRAFDDMSIQMKCLAIARLLDLLPSVAEMRAWLKLSSLSGLDAGLETWVDRILPSSLNILRWIIASNRSCIVPADHELGINGPPVTVGESGSRVLGVNDCLQFRFAMGAPDKEQRFVNSVKKAKARLNLPHPTLYAFHGSPLPNWHSIVRSGLHYEVIANGRAFGNGVYHSLDMTISLGYSTRPTFSALVSYEKPIAQPITGLLGHSGDFYGLEGVHGWLKSILNIQSAVCLNEIVNVPKEFVSSSPYLVVSKLDWIQTRYLFVKVVGIDIQTPSPLSDKVEYLEQDTQFSPIGNFGSKLQIPILGSKCWDQKVPSPVSSPPGRPQRRKRACVAAPRHVRKSSARTGGLRTSPPDSPPGGGAPDESSMLGFATNVIDTENDDAGSDTTETTDVMAYFSDEEEEGEQESIESKSTPSLCSGTGVTLFQPDTHEISSVVLLPPPTNASPVGTRRLTAELHHLLSLQEKYPLGELGFYMNPSSVSNVYQWHIELHSFPLDIPLSTDLAAKNLSSILLEFRFGPNFPMSPPFVRVIRPRFLTIAQGGGGHVTAGGALCMELLTNSGWSAASSMESVLLQIRMAITSEVKPARLVPGVARDYGAREARDAYLRACRAHGWEVPQDFLAMA